LRSPKVSVLMCVHNGERYLREAVESILSQTFTDFEFIIIDDGSTDTSSLILDAFEDPRIVRSSNEGNLGLTRSLNKGLAVARGEHIARMDADDVSLPERLARQVDFLDAHPEVGVLGSQMQVINEAGRVVGAYEVPCRHSMIVWALLFARSFAHPSVMMRRSVLDWCGGYDPSFSCAQDVELWTRLAGHTQFANLSEPLVRYRTHAGAICTQHADIQYTNRLVSVGRFVARILGKEVPPEVLEWAFRSQTPGRVLPDQQIAQVIALISDVYSTMKSQRFFKLEELAEVRADMLRRIMAASRCTPKCVKTVPPHAVPRAYWRSVLPRPIWRVARALAHPRRTVSAVLQRMEVASVLLKRRAGREAPARASASVPRPARSADSVGITLVVLAYERMRALEALLGSLLRQDVAGLGLELILCNNSQRVHLTRERQSRLAKLLRRFADAKVFDSSHNWRTPVRYSLATLARYETILVLDDDITLLDPHFIRYMFDVSQTLRPVDILSCHNTIWVEWTDEYFSTVMMSVSTPEITELTQTDTCGPGICMYNNRILTPRVLERIMRPDFGKGNDMIFPLVAAMECGSRVYFLPCCGMFKFHRQQTKAALCQQPGHYEARYAYYKLLLEEGYRPVLSRLSSRFANRNSPEQRAVRELRVRKHPW